MPTSGDKGDAMNDYLEHGELQEDAPAGPQDMGILIRSLCCGLAICIPSLLEEPPCSGMDASVQPGQKSLSG